MYKILIVEDDSTIAGAVKRHVETWGLEARIVSDFRNVVAEFAAFLPHIVLLDIYLPFFNGYYWCNEIRKISTVPIVFLSSASDNMNVVMAVNMGGDDFVAKPFDLSVLTAKVQAMLRRTYDFVGQTKLLEHNGVVLNVSDGTLLFDGNKIELTKNEFKIMQVLMEEKGCTVSRDNIMARLWQTDSFIDDNTLTVNVNRLRKKLDACGLSNFIATKKGVGYLVGFSEDSD